jgi:hypothetical protein
VRALALAVIIAVLGVLGCGRGKHAIDAAHVGTWVLDRDGSDGRVSAAELELRADGGYRLTITVDGSARLLENQWSAEANTLLLRFAPENTGEERRINAHGIEVVGPDRLSLLYRVKVGEVVRANLVRKR